MLLLVDEEKVPASVWLALQLAQQTQARLRQCLLAALEALVLLLGSEATVVFRHSATLSLLLSPSVLTALLGRTSEASVEGRIAGLSLLSLLLHDREKLACLTLDIGKGTLLGYSYRARYLTSLFIFKGYGMV